MSRREALRLMAGARDGGGTAWGWGGFGGGCPCGCGVVGGDT